MSWTFSELTGIAIEKYHLEPAACDQPDSFCGRCYQLPKEIGTGRVWIFQDGEYRGLLFMDMKLKREIEVPGGFEYAYFSYYESVAGEMSFGTKVRALEPWTLYTNWEPYSTVSMTLGAGNHIRGIRILADPREGMKDIGNGIIEALELGRLMGLRNIPQVIDIIAQIETCPIRNTEKISQLYYHSKVQELLSLYVGSLNRQENYPDGSQDTKTGLSARKTTLPGQRR